MYEKIASDARIYTDLQGLEQLRHDYEKNPNAVKKEVAKQFESILIQMMLKSMRDANKSFTSDLLSTDQMDFYQDIFDKQLALAISDRGIGFAEAVEKNIDNLTKNQAQPNPAITPIRSNSIHPTAYTPTALEKIEKWEEKEKPSQTNAIENISLNSQEEFVKKLWPKAKVAANLIGSCPEILLAQAALETNWGKKIIPCGKEGSSFNLFNIKADSAWTKKTTTMDSLEQKNGVLIKQKSNFRSYESFVESFLDYADFLKQNTRYSEALAKAADPKKFIHALQEAGFATDSRYAEKILHIFSSRTFQNLIAKLK